MHIPIDEVTSYMHPQIRTCMKIHANIFTYLQIRYPVLFIPWVQWTATKDSWLQSSKNVERTCLNLYSKIILHNKVQVAWTDKTCAQGFNNILIVKNTTINKSVWYFSIEYLNWQDASSVITSIWYVLTWHSNISDQLNQIGNSTWKMWGCQVKGHSAVQILIKGKHCNKHTRYVLENYWPSKWGVVSFLVGCSLLDMKPYPFSYHNGIHCSTHSLSRYKKHE